MADLTFAPNFDELAQFIEEKFATLRPLMVQWADLARLAVQGLPHNAQRLAELEARINAIRADLRVPVLVASEHFTEAQLNLLQKQARISKYGWRSLQKKRAVTTKHGFTLVIF